MKTELLIKKIQAIPLTGCAKELQRDKKAGVNVERQREGRIEREIFMLERQQCKKTTHVGRCLQKCDYL